MNRCALLLLQVTVVVLLAGCEALPAAGRLRAKLEDFVVDELVPERVSQEGEHVHVRIEKRGLSTEEAVKRLARALGVKPNHVGRCGRKDVKAVARQWLSFAGVAEKDVEALEIEGVQVLDQGLALATEGDVVLADDGTLRFTVASVSGQDIACRAEVEPSVASARLTCPLRS